MTQPLRNTSVGRSEFSWGSGMFPHPESDYQSFRDLPGVPQTDAGDKMVEEVGRLVADRRTDYTDASSGGAFEGEDELFFVEGNPDAFGPAPKLVQEGIQKPSGPSPQPVTRTGVIREP